MNNNANLLIFIPVPTGSVSSKHTVKAETVVLSSFGIFNVTLYTSPNSDCASAKNLPFFCFNTVIDVMSTPLEDGWSSLRGIAQIIRFGLTLLLLLGIDGEAIPSCRYSI